MSKTQRILPKFEDEFERKLGEALKNARLQFETGKISNATYQHCLIALNTVSRGLCDEPLSLAIDQERDLAGYDQEKEISVWKKGSTLTTLVRDRTGESLKMFKAKANDQDLQISEANFKGELVPQDVSQESQRKLKKRLVRSGYVRVA